MKKLLLSLTLIFVISIMVFKTQAINVSGNINTNTTWILANSPYVVTSSIFVNQNVTLTIEAGVSVLFNSNQDIQIFGTLIANQVTFSSNNTNPSPGDWGSIIVGGWNQQDSGKLYLNNCIVEYTQSLNIQNGKAFLNNTNLSNFLYHGINIGSNGYCSMIGGNINTNSNWAANNGYGIFANQNSSASLSNLNIQNFQSGIFLLRNSNISLSNLNISNCTWPIQYQNSAKLQLIGNNNFNLNTHNVVYVNFYSLTDSLTLPQANVPYYFPGSFVITNTSKLTIASNNVLKFSGGLWVEGVLVADANIGENIYFTSWLDDNWGGDSNNDGQISAPNSQNWEGVIFNDNSNDLACVMRRCKLRFAGSNQKGGISFYNSSPTIENCEISNSYFGFYINGTSNPVLTGNTIGSSNMTPIAMSFEANPVLSNNILSFMDNQYDAIGIIGGIVTENAILKKRSVTNVENITYLLLNQVIIPIGKTLTINKGIVIKSFDNNHKIIVEGTLNAIGTADSIITFTSVKDDNFGNPPDCNRDGTISSPQIGDAGPIIFNPSSNGNLNYCRFKYSSIPWHQFTNCNQIEYLNNCAIAIIDASPTISNCEFKDLDHAISCYRVSNPSITNCQMLNITYTPINISGSSNPTLTNISFTNVGWRAIGILGGNVCQNGIIKRRNLAGFNNITYVLLSDMLINSGTYISTEPGIVIKFKQFGDYYCGGVYSSNIYVDGGYKSEGTSTQKIVYTSIKDDNEGNPFDTNGDGNATTPTPGDWGYLKFRSTSDDSYCNVNYSSFKYGGKYAPCSGEGAIAFENAGGQLNNSTITNSLNYGIYSNGNSTPQINNVNIQNCGLDPIAMSLTSNPIFNNISFVSNFSKAIKIIEGTLSSNANLISRNVAGITNIAYIVSNLEISTNAKLTIQPGVVIKFRDDNSCGWYIRSANIIVYGNLIANGTPTNKIYFTSFADDSKGGDSNNNGNSTIPEKGDWGEETCNQGIKGGIRFINNSIVSDTVNSLKNCEISYAAIGIRVENSHATIDSCLIQLTEHSGISIIGNSSPKIRNSSFFNISLTPIELSLFSKPVFSNCNALNVGFMALGVAPETYSQSDTVPIRNFGGYNNISYLLLGPCTINSGTTIVIPEGVVFKSAANLPSQYYYWETANGISVNGRLNILGTPNNPVVFTNAADDTYGNPADMNQNGNATVPPDGVSWQQNWSGTWLTFNDISDDSTVINNTVLKFADEGISTLSSSPTINNCKFEKLYIGIDMNGVSSPKIDNSIFHNLFYYPIQISLVSYPSSTMNNTISGSTYKVIKVRDETLSQDAVLSKRNFGGINNISYYFEKYNIGTSATLTINPGIVCKFGVPQYYNQNFINISKGLSAVGGSTPDSNIVFTSIKDDFYGGDANSDSSASSPNYGDWTGLIFQDQSLDPLCNFKNCIVRFADKGIHTISASPSFENTVFNNNNYAVYATAASNPIFSNCDFTKNYFYSIANIDQSFIINAENCWWGSNSGPIESSSPGNSNSIRDYVTSFVDYNPWKTNGSQNPFMGDVSLNGVVQAFDASLILKHNVGLINLNNVQLQVADVTANAGVTAYDASLVLQYIVGLIQYFPAELVKNSLNSNLIQNTQLQIDNVITNPGQNINIPLKLHNPDGLNSSNITITYDKNLLNPTTVNSTMADLNLTYNIDQINSKIHIAFAGTKNIINDTVFANLNLSVNNNLTNNTTTFLEIDKFIVNEFNLSNNNINPTIQINVTNTQIEDQNNVKEGVVNVFPNPTSSKTTITVFVNSETEDVKIELYNLIGQNVTTIKQKPVVGLNYFILDVEESNLNPGYYYIKFSWDKNTQTKAIQIIK